MADNNKPVKKQTAAPTTRRVKKNRTLGDYALYYLGRFAKASKRFFAQFGTAVLAVAIVAYVFLQVMLNVGTILDTEHATYVNISDKKEVEAFLFRDEKTVSSVSVGTNCFLVSEGEKVRKGEEIAVTYSNENDVNIQNRINEIDARINVLQKSSLSTGASTTNIALLDNQINELVLTIIRQADKNDYDKILRSKEELLILMNRRQAVIKAEDYSAELKSLSAEKERLNSSLSGNRAITNAPESGYFYSTVDGYEEYFTIDRINNLTAEEFDTLADSVPDKNAIERSAGKIICSSTWYIALSVDKRTAEGYKVGADYPITFQYSNNKELDMTLERKISRSDKDVTILIFSTMQLPAGFDFTRCQTVELPNANYEGLRISTSALRVKDGEIGVYVVVGSKVVFKKTQVLYSYGSYSVCAIPKDPNYPNRVDVAYSTSSQLSLHDAVVVGGKGIYDGMRIK